VFLPENRLHGIIPVPFLLRIFSFNSFFSFTFCHFCYSACVITIRVARCGLKASEVPVKVSVIKDGDAVGLS